jgi:CubicO group peptidase (beta-lactamase class C family)
MAMPFDHAPGTSFTYAQSPLYVVSYAVERATGVDFQEWMDQQILTPLGIPKSHWFWCRDRSGHSEVPGWCMWMDPIDFGRLGQLMLHEGVFRGQRLIDASYMRELRTGTAANGDYGLFTWLNHNTHWVNGSLFKRREYYSQPITSAPEDMYFTWGYHGQHTFILPSLDMVITRSGNVTPDEATLSDPGVWFTAGEQKEAYYTFFKLMMESVKDRQMPPPPVFNGQPSADFDPGDWDNPNDLLGALQLGPQQPQGCTEAGCDQQFAYKGTVDWTGEIPRTGPDTAAGTSKSATTGLASRTLRTN